MHENSFLIEYSILLGDSGGPLTVQSNGTLIQVGIVSFGMRGCERGFPAAFVRVTSFVDWIAENSS